MTQTIRSTTRRRRTIMIITHHITRAIFLTSLQFICLFTYTTSFKRLIPTQFFRFPSSTPRQSYPLYDVSSHSDPNPSTFPPLSKKAVLKKKPGVPLTAEKNKSKPVKTSSLFSEDYKRKSSNHPSITTKSDDLDADDAFPLTEEELSQWQQEEIELLKQEQIERYQQLVAAGEEDPTDHPIQSNKDTPFELPSYMQRLFDQWDLNTTLTLEATPAEKLPTVVIIGRPNTGKSTFVNKLTGSYKDGAIVHDEPGITRDRTYRVASWNGYNFQVVDTGGIIFDDTNDIFAERIKYQALIALKEADVAIMICDGKEGKTNLDDELAEWLRKHNPVPVYVAVSKCESERVGIVQAQDFWSLGLGEPYAVSGIHGTGISDLLDIITSKHMKKIVNVLKENCTNVALIGRPNVGKSSLLNRLVGEERSIVSEVAGTTRDTIDAMVKRGNQTFRLIDTAGIRKKGKVYYGPEFFMVNRAFKAIRRSDVVILLLDALTGIVDQDRILAQRIVDEGRSCVIALNKWDAIPDKDEKSYLKATENIRNSLPGLRFADVLLISAKEGIRTEKLFQSITRSSHQFNRRIPTAILNEVVSDAVLYMTPPTISSKSGRIYYCIQVAAAPPTIVFFVNDPALFPDSYQRFLERKIRDALKFEGTPIRMIFRGKSLREVSRDARRGQIRHTIESVLAKPSRKQLAKE